MKQQSRLKEQLSENRNILVLLLLLLLERLALFIYLGPASNTDADDVGYIASGITFAQTGVISVWSSEPTALIMPGLTILAGLMSLIFGTGTAYIASVKLIIIVLGCLTAWYVYKSARLYTPEFYALLAAAAFLLPNHAWTDNIFATETPYLCFYCGCLYYTFKMSQDSDRKYIWKYSVCFLLSVSFRGNAVVLPVFTAVFLLLCRRYNSGELLKRLLVFCCVSMVLFAPWTIRNYILYNDFLPMGYGAANPILVGTLHGEGTPRDEDLDYETNVYQVLRRDYADYYDENGDARTPAYNNYLAAKRDELMWKYRMRVWLENDPVSFLKSYLIQRPLALPTNVYYWGPAPRAVIPAVNMLSKINLLVCVLGLFMAFIARQKREISLFLAVFYWVNIFIIALSLAIERYAALLLPMRMMAGAIGLYVTVEFVRGKLKNKKQSV